MNLKSKLEDRAEKEKAFEALVAKAEKSVLSEDENANLVKLESEITALDGEIKTFEAIENRKKAIAAKKFATEASAVGATQDNASEDREIEKIAKQFKVGRAFKMVNEKKSIDGAELEVFQMAKAEAKESGIELTGNIAIPQKFIQLGKRKALTVGTEGADVVYTEYGGKVIPYLNPQPVAERLGVTFLQGLNGNVQWPRESGDLAFSFETETSDVDETTPTFNNISIDPKRFGGYVDVTMQMLQQSVFMVEPWLRSKLETRYGITVDQQIFNGSGAGNETTGLFNYNGVNVLSLGSGSANNMTYSALLSMKRDAMAANARLGRAGWVTNAYGEYALYNTPLQASGVEGNFIMNPNSNGNLFADPFYRSNIIPSNFSEGSQSDLCGIAYSSNWAGLIAGFWGGLDILFDPYTQRLGGKVRFVVNAFMDVEIEQPLEFSICKDWDATDLPALT